MQRKIRRSFELVLTLIGIVVIFASVLLASGAGVQVQFLLVLAGVLIMEIGVWALSSHILPNDRRFLSLREEGDRMMDLIRDLNAAAIVKNSGEEEARRFQDTLAQMHESVTLMAEIAARENDTRENDTHGNDTREIDTRQND